LPHRGSVLLVVVGVRLRLASHRPDVDDAIASIVRVVPFFFDDGQLDVVRNGAGDEDLLGETSKGLGQSGHLGDAFLGGVQNSPFVPFPNNIGWEREREDLVHTAQLAGGVPGAGWQGVVVGAGHHTPSRIRERGAGAEEGIDGASPAALLLERTHQGRRARARPREDGASPLDRRDQRRDKAHSIAHLGDPR
jgi:hypothetical protein